jgi:hypothetical protein
MNRDEPDVSIDARSRMIHYEVRGVGLILYSPVDARRVAAKLLAAAERLDAEPGAV